jgi:D-alanyl-D-alanine carboxypeptidase/D-alanyl-D-alanine-endopeptidase (penicillin-binding protein 4)
MKIKTIILSAIIATNAFASEKTNKDWMRNLKAEGINPQEQAYCYTNEANEVEGSNVDMRIRLASVSKLLVSLWSIDKLGIKHTFDTKLFIKGSNLHIQGSFDPFLSNEKMFFLISQLNELGYNKFDTITFDKNLMVFPDAPYLIDEHPDMSRNAHVNLLMRYFNTAKWGQDFKDEYANFKSMAKAGLYRDSVKFEVANVVFSETNPFENDAESRMFTLSSPPLYKYLKEMNVKSNNYVSETTFRALGNAKAFEAYLLEKFNITKDTMKLWTGSGLPYRNEEGTRFDNYSTCKTMLNVVSSLKEEIESQGMEIEDVVAVPGNDKGTFRNRIFPADYKNSFVAKTGTLMHTSTLAGLMNTQKGISFFGVFNQSTDIHGSKSVQNEMVKSIMTEMGGPKAFDYVVESFHTYNGDMLKSLINLDLEDDFSPISGSLK